MFRIWKIKAESRLDALLARLKPSPLMARALPLSLLASLLVAEPAIAQANFEGRADNILGLLSNGLLRTLAIIAIIVVGLLWFLGRASVQMLHGLWGAQPIRIGAQAHLQGFYGQHGFEPDGPIYLEDGIDHIEMVRAA